MARLNTDDDNNCTFAQSICSFLWDNAPCLLFATFVLGFVGLIVRAMLPSTPCYECGPFTFRVNSLDVTSMTFSRLSNSTPLSLGQIDANFNLTLTVMTKRTLLYQTLRVTIEYDHQLLGATNLDPFHQDIVTLNTMHLPISTATHLESKEVNSIVKKFSSVDESRFTVRVHGRYWFVGSTRNTFNCKMDMVCEDIAVTLSSPSNVWKGITKEGGGPFPCKYIESDCSYF